MKGQSLITIVLQYNIASNIFTHKVSNPLSCKIFCERKNFFKNLPLKLTQKTKQKKRMMLKTPINLLAITFE